MPLCLLDILAWKETTPDTSKITHKGTIGAQQTSSQDDSSLNHQRDMTFYNTLFLNAVVHPVGEVGRQFLRQTLDTELPHARPVGAHDRSDVLDSI